jgi:hypothetical protein
VAKMVQSTLYPVLSSGCALQSCNKIPAAGLASVYWRYIVLCRLIMCGFPQQPRQSSSFTRDLSSSFISANEGQSPAPHPQTPLVTLFPLDTLRSTSTSGKLFALSNNLENSGERNSVVFASNFWFLIRKPLLFELLFPQRKDLSHLMLSRFFFFCLEFEITL